MAEDIAGARVHFEAAVQMYPTGADAWTALTRLGKNTQDDALFKKGVAALYNLNQNDPKLAELYAKQRLTQNDWEGAFKAARRWIDIDPFDIRAARLLIKTSMQKTQKSLSQALLGYEVILLLRPEEKQATYRDAITTLKAQGYAKQAAVFEARARKEGITLTP